MALIEGIGDEVIFALGVGVAIILVLVAWWSTYVTESAWMTRVIVLRGHFVNSVTNRPDAQQIIDSLRQNNDSTSADIPSDGTLSREGPVVTTPVAADEVGTSEGSSSDLLPGAGERVEDVDSAVAAVELTMPKSNLLNSNPEPYELRNRRFNFFTKQPVQEAASGVTLADTVTLHQPSLVTNLSASEESVALAGQPAANVEAEGSTESVTVCQDEARIRVRLRYLTESERLVLTNPLETVSSFKRQNFADDLAANKLIRFIFNGQVLQDERTLESYNIIDNTVVHTLISLAEDSGSRSHADHTQDRNEAFDAGSLMLPLFALILSLIWYLRFAYRQFFNVTSTISLLFITLLFGVCLYASYRRQRQPNPTHVHST